jgi:uncharacterized protein (UPF0276 family)
VAAAAAVVEVAAAAGAAVAAAAAANFMRRSEIMDQGKTTLGLGIGWRPELALAIERHPGLGFIEVLAEDLDPDMPIPHAIERLRRRGLAVIPHGVSLSLGGAEPPDANRLGRLASAATVLGASLVSEHIAFVRAGDLESGHLLPVPRTRAALEVLVANVRIAQQALPVPLALENIASLIEWPDNEMDEATFLTELLERTGALLLLDIENVYANARNHGWDALQYLRDIPLERIAYVHIAGGIERAGLYHDTHTHRVPQPVLELLEELCALTDVPGVLLERDDRFPTEAELTAELKAISAGVAQGRRRREDHHVAC